MSVSNTFVVQVITFMRKRQREKETERDTDRPSVAVERREKQGDRKAVRQTDIDHKLKVWERK